MGLRTLQFEAIFASRNTLMHRPAYHLNGVLRRGSGLLLPLAHRGVFTVVVARRQRERPIGAEGVVPHTLEREWIGALGGKRGIELERPLVEILAHIRDALLGRVDDHVTRRVD